MPLCARRRHIVNVENHARKAFIEYPRLQSKRDLRGNQVGLQRTKRPQSQWSKPGRHCQRHNCARERQNSHRQQNPAATDAQRRQGNDLAVRRHAPKSQQHADQRGHRHGEHKHSRKDADKERQNLHAGTAVAHKQLHQPDQLRHEKDKSEDDKSEECVAENFADDIPVQDAHDANGECNTVATTLA